tara:strand:- start:2743 stop:3195 length:453 start_codon:yes stop_codon:yes gene_type:complete
MWWDNIMADRVTTAVLKEKVDNIEKVFSRIDDAIVKIVEVNNNVSKMLAVHDERLVKQEKIDEVLFKKIDDLHVKMVADNKVVLERLTVLERKVWTGLGIIGTIMVVLQVAGPNKILRLLSPVQTSGIIEEVRPTSVELHRHKIYQSSIS